MLFRSRLATNAVKDKVEAAEAKGATAQELLALIGAGRPKRGMLEGDLENGELEIGQITSLFRQQQTVAEVMTEIIEDYERISKMRYEW